MKNVWKYIITAINILFVCILVIPFMIYNYNSTWKSSADYKNYKEEFNCVKDFFISNYYGEEKKFEIKHTKDHSISLLDLQTHALVEMPEDVQYALETLVNKGFPDKSSALDYIRIDKERVAFEQELGSYKLVYSPNNKPTYFGYETDGQRIKVKKIEKGWYHIVISD